MRFDCVFIIKLVDGVCQGRILEVQAVYCRCVCKRRFGVARVDVSFCFGAVISSVYVIQSAFSVVILTFPADWVELGYVNAVYFCVVEVA